MCGVNRKGVAGVRTRSDSAQSRGRCTPCLGEEERSLKFENSKVRTSHEGGVSSRSIIVCWLALDVIKANEFVDRCDRCVKP